MDRNGKHEESLVNRLSIERILLLVLLQGSLCVLPLCALELKSGDGPYNLIQNGSILLMV